MVEGEELAPRLARLLSEHGLSVTVCGREPIAGHGFLADQEEFAGPLRALSRVKSVADYVFVVSCDLPRFNPEVVDVLSARIDGYEAAIPLRDSRLQPLCALYGASSFDSARSLVGAGERRVMRWVESLNFVAVDDVPPDWIANVNTPEELRRLDH